MNVRTTPSDVSAKRLILDALEALGHKAAIGGELVSLEPGARGRHRHDGVVDLVHDNGTTRYRVECKTLVDRKLIIDQVRRQFEDAEGLLIAPYITKELAEHCRTVGLQFIDTCGNAYLRTRGLYVFITGEKKEQAPQFIRPAKGLTNAGGLRVAFALLSKPELVKSPFKDIARHAGVSLGAAYNAIDDLAGRGYLLNGGSSEQRRLLEPGRLADEWAINYPTTLRTKLHGRRFRAEDPEWWKAFDVDARVDFAWGSEVAGSKMTGYLKPSTQTLYVPQHEMDSVIKAVVKGHRLRPDPQGRVEILETFWHPDGEPTPDVVPPLLVYADLLATLDPRAHETAELIKERFIEPTFHHS